MAMLENKWKKKKLSTWVITIVLLIFGLLMVAPFIYMVSVSLERTANLIPPFPPRIIPGEPSLFNYMLAFESGEIILAYINSFITTMGGVVLSVVASLLGGYAFSKGEFKGKKLLFMTVMATMMIPFQTRLIPMHKMFYTFGLTNTYWALILPRILDGFGILLCKQFFDQLPNSLREAAQIDGASEFATFRKVFLPLTGPITATLVILNFMGIWNDFLWPLIALTDNKLQTIPVFMSSFATQDSGQYLAGLTMATATLSIIPIIIVFLALQKYIIESIALSGIKGE